MRHCYGQPGKTAEIEMGVKAGGDGVGGAWMETRGSWANQSCSLFPQRRVRDVSAIFAQMAVGVVWALSGV